MKRISSFIVMLSVCGCGGEESQPPSPAPYEAEPVARVMPRDRPTEVEMVSSMEGHYSVVILSHDALLQGDLPQFRSQLALVETQTLPPSSPDTWLPFHDQLKVAAASGANAADLDSAALSLASVVQACGTCHAALASGPIYPAPAPDDGDNVIEAAMLDHQWATERLWEGVTGPWDLAWQRGAAALAETQVFGNLGEEVILSDDLRHRERELRAIGEEALVTTALDARARLYGRLLSTCGACHQAVGVDFSPEN